MLKKGLFLKSEFQIQVNEVTIIKEVEMSKNKVRILLSDELICNITHEPFERWRLWFGGGTFQSQMLPERKLCVQAFLLIFSLFRYKIIIYAVKF